MVFVQDSSALDGEDVKLMEFGGGIKMKKTTTNSMMLKSEHGRRGGDDRIIANDGQQDELDELTEAPHKASHVGL